MVSVFRDLRGREPGGMQETELFSCFRREEAGEEG